MLLDLLQSLVDEVGLDSINKSAQRCKESIEAGRWTEATQRWGSTQTAVVIATNGVNFYNILKWGQEESSLFSG